jgi:peptide/nickel transport system substrate-binding protein
MDWAAAENYIPYAPTLADYITADEAAERWANLQNWYSDKGHFWVGSGPFYLEEVDTTQKAVRLKRLEDYPDPMDRWLFLLEPLP